jgi:hypothetical protein
LTTASDIVASHNEGNVSVLRIDQMMTAVFGPRVLTAGGINSEIHLPVEQRY